MPSFRKTPASSTDPTVGARPCASGSQVCRGTSGTFTARPPAMRHAASNDSTPLISSIWRLRASRPMTTMPTSSSADPVTVNSRNRVAARLASAPPAPQRAMTNHIGMSASSKKTKNSSRSSDTNTPIDAAATTSRSATRSGDVSGFSSHRQHSSVRNAVSRASGNETPSTPRWRRAPSGSIHAWSISPQVSSVPPRGTSASSSKAARDATAPSSAAERPVIRRESRTSSRAAATSTPMATAITSPPPRRRCR